MKKNNKKSGYILLLTMIITSMLVALVTRMFYSSSVFSTFAIVATQREQAKALAQSGMYIACAQLYVPAQTQKKETPATQPTNPISPAKGTEQKQEQQQDDPIKLLLEQVIPVLNSLQTIKFNTETSGVDGAINFYITCEEGKLHLNDLLTLITDPQLPQEKQKFFQSIFARIASVNTISENLYQSAARFFEKRKHVWLNDTTEILSARGFESFTDTMFVKLPIDKKNEHSTVYFVDLFTPQSRYGKLDPWVLSRSTCLALGMAYPNDKTVNDGLKAALKNFKKSYSWNTDWNAIFKPIYGIEFSALDKTIASLLPTNGEPFNPVAFSVTVYATVGRVTQGVHALLLRKKQQDHSIAFVPIKYYWI